MERGVRVLVRMLAMAALLGSLVIALHPAYRATAVAMWRGDVTVSPIWKTNLHYYREVVVEPAGAHEAAK